MVEGCHVKGYVLWVMRLVLVFAFVIGLYDRGALLVAGAFIGLLVTFLPSFVSVVFRRTLPADFEIILFLFLFGGFMFLEDFVFGPSHILFGFLVHFGSAVLLGFLGLSLFYVLESERLVSRNSFLLFLFTFGFVFSLGALWEVFVFFLGYLFQFGLDTGRFLDTMLDLLLVAVGAFLVGFWGFLELRSGRRYFVSTLVLTSMRRYFGLGSRSSGRGLEYSSSYIRSLIGRGEHDRIEFKSTLRYNLHTKAFDKKIEHAVLKTIVGYLNSKGGVLLVGVNDSGNVIGIEKDGFETHDKLQLYVTSMLREYLGSGVLGYIDYSLYPVDDLHVLKIDCRPALRRIFLKWQGKEEFYVRHGSSTIQLEGNALLDYVHEHFS